MLGMLAADDTAAKIREGYPWMELEDVQACLVISLRARRRGERCASPCEQALIIVPDRLRSRESMRGLVAGLRP